MTGGPFLVEHCFTNAEVEILTGKPAVYTHVSAGSGKEVKVHFCPDCSSRLFLTFQRWDDVMNVVTTSFDTPKALRFDAETLQYLFVGAAQSGTVIPKGFRAFEGHCDPADGSAVIGWVSEHPILIDKSVAGSGPHCGGCLCGAVRFEADDLPEAAVICHCASCQKTMGSGVNFELLWRPEGFRLVSGTPRTYRHSGGSGKQIERRFCADCGTSLWLTGERFEEVGVFRGTLDDPNRIPLTDLTASQIFLDDALPSSMVIAGIEAFTQHRRAPDGSIRAGRTFDQHRRIGGGIGF